MSGRDRRGRRASTRAARPSLFVGAASGGVWKSQRRRHHVQAGLRQAAGAVDRRDHDRSVEPEDDLGRHRRGVDAQLGLDRRRHLQVDRRRRDLDEHGPADVGAHRAHPRPSEEQQRRLRLRAGQAVERQRRSRRSTRRPTAARPGRWCSRARTCRPAARRRRWIRRTPTCSSPACGTSAARAGPSAPAATVPTRRAPAASIARPTAARRGARSRRDEQGPAARRRGAASRSSYAPSDPKIVYAFDRVERRRRCSARTTAARPGSRATSSQMMVWRPFYFARLVVDPTNPNRLFKPDLQPRSSARTAARASSAPAAARTATGTTSGSIRTTPSTSSAATTAASGSRTTAATAGGRRTTCPISQFYHVSVDNKDPYQVYGGLQDNSSWVGDSSYPGGITNQRWENLYGGDGFWAVVDPTDPERRLRRVAGRLHRPRRSQDARRRATSSRRPRYKEKLRFNWNTPIARQPDAEGHDLHRRAVPLPLARSRRHLGAHLAGPDDERSGEAEAGAVGRRHRRQLRRPRCTRRSTRSASRRRTRTSIWVGTDDGNLQLTRDGGKTLDQRRRQRARAAEGVVGELGRGEPLRRRHRATRRSIATPSAT